MRRLYESAVIAMIVLTALAVWLVAAMPASAQFRELTPADMRIDTPCYKTGIGRNPRTQQIVQAQVHAQRVGPDGYWRLCEEAAHIGRTVGDITRGTACGVPAVGIDPVTGVIYAAANPHEYVTADGVWQRCPDTAFVTKPAAPKPVRCDVPEVLRWSAGTEPGAYVASDYSQCIGKGGVSLGVGQSLPLTANAGDYSGVLVLRCSASGLDVSVALCSRAEACIASAYRGSDDGGSTWWTYQGRLPEGVTAQASGPDGRSRPVQCIGGRLRLLPEVRQ